MTRTPHHENEDKMVFCIFFRARKFFLKNLLKNRVQIHTARDNFLMEQGHVNAQQCDQIQRNFAILAKILSLTAISSWLFEILGEFPSL